MLKNYLITSLTSCENLKLIKPGVLNPDLALLFIPLCLRHRIYGFNTKNGTLVTKRCGGWVASIVGGQASKISSSLLKKVAILQSSLILLIPCFGLGQNSFKGASKSKSVSVIMATRGHHRDRGGNSLSVSAPII